MSVINDLSTYREKGRWENTRLKENCISGSEGGMEASGRAAVGLSYGIRKAGQQPLLCTGHEETSFLFPVC